MCGVDVWQQGGLRYWLAFDRVAGVPNGVELLVERHGYGAHHHKPRCSWYHGAA